MSSIPTTWARLLVDGLVAAGVESFVVSPGSRSTPLVCAIDASGARRHAVVDERSAGFFALGRARVTGRPAALVCTSGTAGAHYLPAVIEAAEARVPLVVLTADRPPELQGCAAPQTIDQTHLFGRFVRRFIDLGLPDPSPSALRALRRRAAQAVVATRHPDPGPVHLNVPARKPLEPVAPTTDEDRQVEALAAEILARPLAIHTAAPAADDRAADALAEACAGTERGVVIAGPAPVSGRGVLDAVARFARATGFAVLAEASSQLRLTGPGGQDLRCDGFDLVLGDAAARRSLAPDIVVQLGRPPTSATLARYLAEQPARRRFVIADHGWNDPRSDATDLVFADIGRTLDRAAGRLDGRAPRGAWRQAWRAADERAWSAVERRLAAGGPMREGQATRAAVSAAPDGALVALGNSLPIRTVDTYCPGRIADVDVWCQRGANGIDGLVSGIAGAASAGDRPVVALIGDVSTAHDIGGLAAARLPTAPLVFVVLDNRGGRIFQMLPVAASREHPLQELWLTPPKLDLEAAARAYGHRYREADTPAALSAAVAEAAGHAGCTVVRAIVDPDSAAADLEALRSTAGGAG